MNHYISIEEARAAIETPLGRRQPLPAEMVSIRDALGRTLAETIYTDDAVPPFPRSAMDGYALKSADTPGTLRVIGVNYAGYEWPTPVGSGEAVRVMTGAPIPPGVDTVLEQERVHLAEKTIRIDKKIRPERNIMPRGHEYPPHSVIVPTGTRLTAVNIGQLASIGLTHVPTVSAPSVLVLTTGDELQERSPLMPGKIYNTNGPLLQALLSTFHAKITRQHLADDATFIRQSLDEASDRYDLILTTGGVSVGDRDYLPNLLDKYFERLFWRVNMHPGKAMAAAMIGETPLIALSGNPGAMLTSWYVIVAPIMAALTRTTWTIKSVTGSLAAPYSKSTREKRFLKARFRFTHSGLLFDIIDNQSSDALSSFALADGLVMIESDRPPQDQGTPLEGFWLPRF